MYFRKIDIISLSHDLANSRFNDLKFLMSCVRTIRNSMFNVGTTFLFQRTTFLYLKRKKKLETLSIKLSFAFTHVVKIWYHLKKNCSSYWITKYQFFYIFMLLVWDFRQNQHLPNPYPYKGIVWLSFLLAGIQIAGISTSIKSVCIIQLAILSSLTN